MSTSTAIAIAIALVSTALINVGYVRQHAAASALPPLSIRRPMDSARLLFTNRVWMQGFWFEAGGFVLYASALALASLALVQTILAGGIGLLAIVSSRITGRRLSRRERDGAILSLFGLAALGVSLAGGSDEGSGASTAAILLWFAVSAAAAGLIFSLGRRLFGGAAVYGIAGGIFFSIGDISTKLVTEGGARTGFALTLIAGFVLGTALLQRGYQLGGALTVAGLATVLTNALPIAAGTIVLGDPVPPGLLGALRVLAFVTVTIGALLLAQPDEPEASQKRVVCQRPRNPKTSSPGQ